MLLNLIVLFYKFFEYAPTPKKLVPFAKKSYVRGVKCAIELCLTCDSFMLGRRKIRH